MGFSDKQLRTIKCDGPGCDKEVEFDLRDVKAIQAIEWLKGVRVIQRGDNKAFSYCSDVCEVKGVTTGQHNLPDKPLVAPATEGDVRSAVAQAEASAQTTEALKTGEGEAKITLS
jgi:hypothetical protein